MNFKPFFKKKIRLKNVARKKINSNIDLEEKKEATPYLNEFFIVKILLTIVLVL